MRIARTILFATLAALLVLAPGAGRQAAAQDPASGAGVEAMGYQELSLVGSDYAFEAPATIEAGYTLVTFDNVGQDIHHAQLAKLNEGTTVDQFIDALPALETDPGAVLSLVTPFGGPAIIAPGGRAQVILDLEPGQYVWLCALDAPDGELHFEKGMVQSFEVVAAETEPAAAEPVADATLVFKDFSFELPETIGPGRQIWQVINVGPQPHEIILVQLAPDATAMDFLMALDDPAAGPPPGLPVGGMQGVMPGLPSWLVLDLEPGNYAAFCFVPDPESGMAHIELGMIAEFTVGDGS